MTGKREEFAEKRAETDASLGVERTAADSAIARTAAKAQRRLEALITRDRILEDEGVMRFRQDADELLESERSATPEPSEKVVQKRLAADDSKSAERSVTDEVIQQERQRTDVGGETLRTTRADVRGKQEAHRRETNERRSDERSDADDIADERDTTRSALEVARGAEADRADVFAMVTHDLRSPLCVIVVNAGLIEESSEDEFTREAAEQITSAAARMGRLLTDLIASCRCSATCSATR